MNDVIDRDDVMSVIKTFLDCNESDDATEQLIIAIGCELLCISEDKLLEIIGK